MKTKLFKTTYLLWAIFAGVSIVNQGFGQTIGTIECECLNNQSSPGDGQFLDKVVVQSGPGEIWYVTFVDSLFDTKSAPPPAEPNLIALGTQMSEIKKGVYILEGKRIEGTDWYIIVSNKVKSLFAYPRHHCEYHIPEIIGDSLTCMQQSREYEVKVPINLYSNIKWEITAGGKIKGDTTTEKITVASGIHPTMDTLSLDISVMPSTFGNGTPCFFHLEKEVRTVDEIECQLLPLTLVSFEGHQVVNGTILNWETKEEENVDYFEIQKSVDTKEWLSLAKIKATNNKVGENYNFKDFTNNTGIVFYRLRMVDFDGSFSFSDIIVVNTKSKQEKELTIYPNPSTGLFYLDYDEATIIKNIKISNAAGEVMMKSVIETNNNQVDISFLPNGIYNVNINTVNGVINKRVIKL
jgi:hypothetical protein